MLYRHDKHHAFIQPDESQLHSKSTVSQPEERVSNTIPSKLQILYLHTLLHRTKHYLSRLRNSIAFRGFLLATVFMFPFEFALSETRLYRTANLFVIAEAILVQSSILRQETNIDNSELNWILTNPERHWKLRISGNTNDQDTNIVLSGFLWGKETENLVVQYSGTGTAGSRKILVHGHATWIYSPTSRDYRDLNFKHVTRIGENSFWVWIVGTETVAGAIIGGGGAVATATLVTGGLGLPTAGWIASAGAIGGANGLVSISTMVRDLVDSGVPLEPPTPPPPPVLNDRVEIQPSEGYAVVALTDDGNRLAGYLDGGEVSVVGEFDAESDDYQGSVSFP